MFRLSSAICREVLKYMTDYFYKIIVILSLLNTEEHNIFFIFIVVGAFSATYSYTIRHAATAPC